jgi:hypothetical protein
MKINKSININFNNKSYSSLDEIPNEIKNLVKDEDGNGIPDFVESVIKNTSNDSKTKITVNGQEFDSIPKVKEVIENINKFNNKKEENNFSHNNQDKILQRYSPDKTTSFIFVILILLILIFLILK